MFDKLGYKTCMLIIGITVTIIIPSLPLLTLLEPDTLTVSLMWGLLMVILFCTFPGVFPLVAAVCNTAFGPEYYSANFGLFFTSSFVYNGILVIFTQVPILFNTLDYTGIFFFAGGVGVLGVVVTACLPRRIKLQESGKL